MKIANLRSAFNLKRGFEAVLVNYSVKSFLLMMLGVVLFPCSAAAIVTGAVEWRLAEYQRETDDGSRLNLSHFYQDYSLLYREHRSIQSGQAGEWTLGLGYEWSALDIDGTGGGTSVNEDKILYEGELKFAPPGLPFRLEVFSHDLTRIRADEFPPFSDAIIDPRLLVSLDNEQRLVRGLTLLVGGDDANLFGEYRTQLAALPRLLVDYWEERVRDREDDDNNYRIRDLSLVSLNRKNNWFHYKNFEFTDYYDPGNSFTEEVWLIGTVDHLNRRHWINLTNWLNISVDGSLTRRDGEVKVDEELYRLNLFSKGNRRAWRFSNFTSLTRRTTELGVLEKSFDFPLFAEIQIDPLNKLRLMLIEASREDRNPADIGGGFARRVDNLYARAQHESKRYEGRLLTSTAEAEVLRDDLLDDGQAARLAVELRSGDYKVHARDWLVAASAGWFDRSRDADTDFDGETRDQSGYYELASTAAANFRLTPSVSIGGSEKLAVGEGNFTDTLLNHMVPTISQAFRHSGQWQEDEQRPLSGTSWRSTTEAYVELAPAERWRNRFGAYLDVLHVVETLHQAQVEHALSYSQGQFWARTYTSLIEGDELSYRWQTNELGTLDTVTGPPELIFNHETRAEYRPNQYWMAGGMARAVWGKGDRGDGWLLEVEQEAAYHLYETAGIPRKWLSLQERFNYERVWGHESLWYARMELDAIYYLTRYLTINAEFDVGHYGLTGQNQYEVEVTATAAFRKLEAHLTYAYGQTTQEGTLAPGLKEQLWEVGIRKTF